MSDSGGKKRCKGCHQALPLDAYYQRKNGTYENTCRKCRQSAQRTHNSSREGYLRNLANQGKYTNNTKNRAEWKIDADHIFELWENQEGRCALSGVFMTHHKDGGGHKEFNASLDRINPDLGYIHGNVQLVAYRVNIMKHTLSEDQLYWWVKNLVEKQSTNS